MVERVSGPAETELPLLPAQGDVAFAIKSGEDFITLRYSEWSPRRIFLSQEGAKKVKGEIWMAISLGQFRRPWEKLPGRVEGNQFIIEGENRFLQILYQNQGSVPKTLNLVGGPLTTEEGRKRKKWFQGVILVILGFLLLTFGYDWWSFHASRVIEIKELTEHISKLRSIVEQDEKLKEKLPEEVKASEEVLPTLVEQAKITGERVKILESAERGTIKSIVVVEAKVAQANAIVELEREKGKIKVGKAEVLAMNRQSEALGKLSLKLEFLKSDTYWKRFMKYFQ